MSHERKPQSPISPKKPKKPLSLWQKVLAIVVVSWGILAVWSVYSEGTTNQLATMAYSDAVSSAKAGLVKSAVMGPTQTTLTLKDNKQVRVNAVPESNFAQLLVQSGVKVAGANPPAEPSVFSNFFMMFGPVLLLISFWIYTQRKDNMGNSGPMGTARAKSKSANMELKSSNTTFADVAGCDEAKEEVRELVDFLKNPAKFQKLGGRSPKGILLSGPPGTGKTLLAQAIAGEAQVPFYSLSGSDFVEMFVGVGASRARDLFARAKQHSPCIIFIDEIDAVGRQRGAGHGGGNDEREQTLNQILVEMDGFDKDAGIIVIAATNRPDILDKALTRPGRFDRMVHVALPDVRGREQILAVHLRKVPMGQDVDVHVLARGTPGSSGADLANLVNEAALLAARRDSRHVEMVDFEKAKDKVTMGTERKSIVMPEEERKNTAYHEAGHAIVAELLPKTDPVHKVSIIPRGRALGVTLQLPEGDRYSTDKERLENTIAVLFGGRIAEELFMHQATTGASNDFERATVIARNMVTRWGYSKVLGPMVLVGNDTDPNAGAVSAETAREIDMEVRALLQTQYARVVELLQANKGKMEAMAAALLEWETINADQVADVMADRSVRAPAPTVPAANSASTAANTFPPMSSLALTRD